MENSTPEIKNPTYELFIGALSILSILNLFLFYLVPDPIVANVIRIIDFVLSLIFLLDFLYRLTTSESKLGYFFRQRGWVDLITCVPIPLLKFLRLVRVMRLSKPLRQQGSRRIIKEFLSNRGRSALLSLFFMIIILLEFGGLILLNVESISPDSNIKNASDVLWYIFVSITTVGYGDKFPVTNAGRIIGILILTAGVGLFGTLTAYLSNAFIKPKEEKPDHSGEISKDVYEINRQMTAILNSLKSIEGSNAELKARLEEIEDTLRKRELR